MSKVLTGAQFAKVVCKAIAKKYNVSARSVEKSFSLTPTQTQTLNRDMYRTADFLRYVDIQQRQQQVGTSLIIGSQGPATKTNNTKAGDERRLNTHKEMTENPYIMRKMHTDFIMHDDDIAEWSEFDNWPTIYKQAFNQQFNNDRQMIMFHGEQWVENSDLETYPLMQDVNVGIRTLLQERNSANYLTGDENGEIRIGSGAGYDYKNLDHYVQDLYQAIPMHRRQPGMTLTIGEGLLAADRARLYSEQAGTPSEKQKMHARQVIGSYAGLPAITANYFPENGVMITGLKREGSNSSNIAIYHQRKSWKRSIEYKADIESTVDWNARRECNHIKDVYGIVMGMPEKIIMIDDGNHEIAAVPDHKWDN